MSWRKWNGHKAKQLMQHQVSDAVYEAGTSILVDAKKQVPLDESTLQNSGEVYKNPGNPLSVAINFGYGSGTGKPKIPYAVKWHEVPANFQHGRKNDYLIDPLKQTGPRALKRALEKQIKESF